ncbi:MAG: hypothetical protein FWC71_07745 [Defluviitaleaceae bacterium]|nr:hypothetical protein [Defluviitaleaceae bacterium]
MEATKTTKRAKNWVVVLLIAALAFAAAMPHLRTNVAAQPGDVLDPLVTRRYVDERIDDVWSEIQVLRAENALLRAMVESGGLPGIPFDVQTIVAMVTADVLAVVHGGNVPGAGNDPDADVPGAGVTQPPPGPGAGEERSLEFVSLNLTYGQRLFLENGTEVILRTGTATVISGPEGLVDMTQGLNVSNGASISRNHLLITPRTDGRGLRFTSQSNWVMVRGAFTID